MQLLRSRIEMLELIVCGSVYACTKLEPGIGERVALLRRRHIRMTNPSYDPRLVPSPSQKRGGSSRRFGLSPSLSFSRYPLFPFVPGDFSLFPSRNDVPPAFFLLIFSPPDPRRPLTRVAGGSLVESECDYDEWILQGAPR